MRTSVASVCVLDDACPRSRTCFIRTLPRMEAILNSPPRARSLSAQFPEHPLRCHPRLQDPYCRWVVSSKHLADFTPRLQREQPGPDDQCRRQAVPPQLLLPCTNATYEKVGERSVRHADSGVWLMCLDVLIRPTVGAGADKAELWTAGCPRRFPIGDTIGPVSCLPEPDGALTVEVVIMSWIIRG